MPGIRPPAHAALGSLDGARKCICDPLRFPDCPGHKPPYLAGQRTRARPSLATMAKHEEKAAEAWDTLAALRPNDDELEIERRTNAKTPWRAHAGYHWPQGDEQQVYRPRGAPTGSPMDEGAEVGESPHTTACHIPARPRPRTAPPASSRIVSSLYTTTPSRDP